MSVATPLFTYTPPTPADSENNIPAHPANVVAAIPAPVVPIPPTKQYGEPAWVKVIKTKAHNTTRIALKDLTGDDRNGDTFRDWTNGEAEEVETEWKLLQINNDPLKADKDTLQGAEDSLESVDENVTRRYEFYRYAADDHAINPNIADGSSRDGENGEAMCDEVDPATDPSSPGYLHGKNSNVEVTDAKGNSYTIDCTQRVVVGDYLGAQMSAFDPQADFGLIDHLPDGELNQPYTPRTLVIGGNTPYSQVTVSRIAGDGRPALPTGMALAPETGVLSGTPASAGYYPIYVYATDAAGRTALWGYNLYIADPSEQLVHYPLSVLSDGPGRISGGSIDCSPFCSADIHAGESVTLTADPIDSTFAGWKGDACDGSTENTCTVTMEAAKFVSAKFFIPQHYYLTIEKDGTGTGTVTGNGVECGNTCFAALNPGSAVSLTAIPAADSLLAGWSGCDSVINAVCNVVMDASTRKVTATFTRQYYTLTALKHGNDTVSGGPIDCGASCAASIGVGSSVTLTATPAAGSIFSGWHGCPGTADANTCTVTMDSDKYVTADFMPLQYRLSVTKTNAAYGTVTSSPAGISCGTSCSFQYNSGTAVTLTAKPSKGRKFAGWTGACTGSKATCSVSMSQDKTVNAAFK